MSNTFADNAMWESATTDHDAEARRGLVVRAKVAIAGCWPFLAAAQSEEEFEQRLALMLPAIAAQTDPEVLGEVVAGLSADYATVNAEQLAQTASLRRQAALLPPPLMSDQEFWDGSRWIQATAVMVPGISADKSMAVAYRDRSTDLNASEFFNAATGQWQRDASFRVSGVFTPDPSDAERYSHYPPTPPSPGSGGSVVSPGAPGAAHSIAPPQVGPDGFPIDLAEGEQRTPEAYALQTTPGQWVAPPGGWPAGDKPNAATGQAQASRRQAINDGNKSTDDFYSYQGRGRGQNVWGTNKADVDDDYCEECEHPTPGHYTNCPRHRNNKTSADNSGSIHCTKCGGSGMRNMGGAIRNCTSCKGTGIKRGPRKQIDKDLGHDFLGDHEGARRTAGDGHTVKVTGGRECDIHKYEKGTPGVPATHDGKTVMGPWANMCDDCFATHGVGTGVGRGQKFTSTQRHAGEGVVPTPGGNPNYFSQGNSSIMGPAEYPQDPNGGAPKTNNNADDFYGAVPPVNSTGSDGSEVSYSADDSAASAPTPGSNGATAGRRHPFTGAKHKFPPGYPHMTVHPVNPDLSPALHDVQMHEAPGDSFPVGSWPPDTVEEHAQEYARGYMRGHGHGSTEVPMHHVTEPSGMYPKHSSRGRLPFNHGSSKDPESRQDSIRQFQDAANKRCTVCGGKANPLGPGLKHQDSGRDDDHAFKVPKESMRKNAEYTRPDASQRAEARHDEQHTSGNRDDCEFCDARKEGMRKNAGLLGDLHRMDDGAELDVAGHKVEYNSEQANGDDGRPARGFTVGGYGVSSPDGDYKYFRHSPYKPNSWAGQAKRVAAEDVIDHLVKKQQRQGSRKTAEVEHLQKYMDWAKDNGHNNDDLSTLLKYEKTPGVGRATTNRIADEYHGEGEDWREKARYSSKTSSFPMPDASDPRQTWLKGNYDARAGRNYAGEENQEDEHAQAYRQGWDAHHRSENATMFPGKQPVHASRTEPGLGCPHCKDGFYKESDRTAHIRDKHPGEYSGPSADMAQVKDRLHDRKASTDGKIVGHCDNCNKPVRYHTNENGKDELHHLHNDHNRCGHGDGYSATASIRTATEELRAIPHVKPQGACDVCGRNASHHLAQSTDGGPLQQIANVCNTCAKDYDGRKIAMAQFFEKTADDVRNRRTLADPTGVGDEFRSNTWDSQMKQRPMQSAEDRGINTPVHPQEPDTPNNQINSPYPGTVLDGEGGVRGRDDDEEANSERSRVT